MMYDVSMFDDESNLSVVDAFTKYLQEIKKYRFITPEEEIELSTRYINDNDLEAAHQLITSHLRYVAAIAYQYKGYDLPLGDLVQEGNIGLMKAVKRFDPSRGVRLSSYALIWIKSEIANYVINNWRLVKIASTKAQRKLFFNLRSLQQAFGYLPADEMERIANELKVTPQEVADMEKRFVYSDFSLDYRPTDGETDGLPSNDHDLLSLYGKQDDRDPPTILEEIQQLEHDIKQSIGLYRELKELDNRAQRIVTARWLSEDANSTLDVLSKEFDISKERVRQIEIASLKKLKLMLAC